MTQAISEMTVTYLVDASTSAVPQGYKQTDVGIIPEDWLCTDIGALNPFVTSGSRGWAEFYSEYGQPFVRITNTKRHSIYLDLSDLKFVKLPENSSEGKRTSLANGDVLISITADIGISSYVDESLVKPAYINQHIALVRFNLDEINSKFVTYFLSSENVQKLFRSTSDQGAKAGLNLDSVRKIQIALPSKSEQTAIANALSDVDALIQELENLIAKKQAIKTATMQQLLTGRTRLPQFAHHPDGRKKGYKPSELGEIPEDWDVVTVDSMLELLTDFEANGSFETVAQNVTITDGFGHAWYVRATDLENNSDLGKVKYVDQNSYEFLKKTALFGNELLITKRGEIGKVYLFKKKTAYATVAPNLYLLKLNQTINVMFLFYFFKSEVGQRLLKRNNASTSLGALYKDDVKGMTVAKPIDSKEQTSIALILSDMDEEIQKLEQRLNKTRQIKQGMMQELLTGKTRLVKPAGAA